MGNEASTENKVYSKAVPGSEKEGWGPVYRSPEVWPDKPLAKNLYPEVTTLYENFQRGATKFPDNPCLGSRKLLPGGERGDYLWQSYATVNKRQLAVAGGLLNYGMQKGDHLGIYAQNCPEWVIAEQACYTQGIVPISLYDTLGPDAVSFILQEAEIKVIVASKDKIPALLQAAKSCPLLKLIIQMEKEGDKAIQEQAQEAGIKLISFSEVEDNGAFYSREPNPPAAQDLATIMYTSGTTGNPKGVMITHAGLISMISGAAMVGITTSSNDVHISYLPLAHIFERALQGIFYCEGSAVGFFQGSVLKLFDDIQALRPTVFVSVPRLWNRLYDKVQNTLRTEGGIKKFLFESGFNSKKSTLEGGGPPTSGLWDSIIFNKMKAKLGGRVRLMITGAAPLSADVHRFLQVAFCVPLLQGYGLTETAAAATLTRADDFTVGHVGAPILACEVRLCDVPEMNYSSKNDPPTGEVCIRGHNVFIGYYKNPEKTAEDLDKDGWFHTGDIGRWHANGNLQIIDRKKNIFKLAQGEYVAAEHVEAQYIKSPYIQQCFIYGDSFKAELVAIVVPDPEVLGPWAKENGHGEDMAAVCAKPAVKEFLFAEMNKTGKECKLKGFEFAKAIHVEAEPFSAENELLTPTFKPKRPQLKNHYQAQIDAMYAELGEKEAAKKAAAEKK